MVTTETARILSADDADDDFAPVPRPSIAALHRRWLDQGLPARSWVDWLRQYGEMYGDVPRPVEHTHIGSCNPSCRRWSH